MVLGFAFRSMTRFGYFLHDVRCVLKFFFIYFFFFCRWMSGGSSTVLSPLASLGTFVEWTGQIQVGLFP